LVILFFQLNVGGINIHMELYYILCKKILHSVQKTYSLFALAGIPASKLTGLAGFMG
jgi:hypothetical protein